MNRAAVAAIAVLDDDTRRSLYAFVRAAERPVTRESAASAVGVSRNLAAFHLDKLVDAGLLRARIDAPEVRQVGRAPKVYEPSGQDVAVCVPERDPQLLAAILVEAVLDEQPGERASAAVSRVAHARGVAAGADERERVRPGRLGPERAMALSRAVLERHGFEPALEPGGLRLRNCPFHPLAAVQPELVCGLNHAFLCGLLTGLQAERNAEAVLAPRAGECCVQIRPRP